MFYLWTLLGRMRQIDGRTPDSVITLLHQAHIFCSPCTRSYQPNIIKSQIKIYNLPYFLYSSKFILNANARMSLIWWWLRFLVSSTVWCSRISANMFRLWLNWSIKSFSVLLLFYVFYLCLHTFQSRPVNWDCNVM